MNVLNHSIAGKISQFIPIIVIVNLAVVGMLSMFAATYYMHLSINPILGILSISIIAGIYILNRYSDINEDFANDHARMIFILNKNRLYPISIMLLVASLLLLVLMEKITMFHMVLFFVGVAYSYPLFPWYTKKKGAHCLRLKQIPLVKNLSVSFLWGFSIFLIPLLFTQTKPSSWVSVDLLIAAQIIATLSNTLFSDIRDEIGDRISGNLTLPVLWGANATYAVILVINVLWTVFNLFLLATQYIDPSHFMFFLVIALYPAIYITAYNLKKFSKGLIDLLGDLQLLVYAGGLFLLARHQAVWYL